MFLTLTTCNHIFLSFILLFFEAEHGHMEVHRLGVESELKLLIIASATDTTVHSHVGSLIHLVRPGIKPSNESDSFPLRPVPRWEPPEQVYVVRSD